VPRCSEPSRTHALRAPLRGGLRPSLTTPARRDAPDGVGTKGVPTLRPIGLRPGSNKGLTGKEVAGLLGPCGPTTSGHGLGSRNVGRRRQLPQLLRRELGCIRTVADLTVRHPALDPGQRIQSVPIKRGLQNKRLNGSAAGWVPGDRREGFRLGASPSAGEGLLAGCQALTSASALGSSVRTRTVRPWPCSIRR